MMDEFRTKPCFFHLSEARESASCPIVKNREPANTPKFDPLILTSPSSPS
jgi:hypothetical protein